MPNNVAYYEIQSNEPFKTIDFYTAVFGWKFIKAEGMPIDYWRIEGGGINGGLLGRPVPVPPGPAGTNAYVCSVLVEDYDATAAKIMAADGRDAMGKFAVPGVCWQGYFLDLDSNTFGIFQPDELAS